MRLLLCLLAILVFVGACTAQPESRAPTLAVLPTQAVTLLPTLTPSSIDEATPAASQQVSPAPSLPAETSFPVLIGNINVTSAPGIILRRAPSASADVIAVLPGGSVVRAQRRTSDGAWIEVASDQGLVGWVEARDVFAVNDFGILPALAVPAQIALAPTVTLNPEPTRVALGDVPAMERRLNETPLLTNTNSERVQQIFARGRDLGNRPDVFTTVGDSNTTNGDFLQPIGMNADAYCTWGDYGSLRETVNYFSTPPSSTDSNSFVHHSVAARKGFSTAAVLDPFWATAGVCEPGEKPLLCEYRTIKPSAAVVMLGGIDINDLTTDDYAANMRQIVQMSMDQGVIPVLTTFVVLPEREVYERSLEFNMVLLDIADEQQIPLINLWAAAQPLPDEGIGTDHTHLKAVVGSFCSFDGSQNQYGGTLRNLLTLQALDALRQNVLVQ